MKFIGAIFGTGVFFYAVTILIQYGHNSYFGIPPNMIEPSIRDNIIYFFDLFKVMGQVAGALSFWTWIGIGVIAIIIWFLAVFQMIRGALLFILLAVLTGSSLLFSYNLGTEIAKGTTNFRTVPTGCLPADEDITFIVPAFYQTTALIVSVHTDTNRLTGGFYPREASELGCELKRQEIGRISSI